MVSHVPISDEATPESLDPIEPPQKPYTKPAIVHELRLETRAGSPLDPNAIDDPWSFLRPFDPRPRM